MNHDENVMLTPRQVQRILNLSPSTVYRMMTSGTLPSVRIGRSRRVPTSSLAKYFKSEEDGHA